MKRLVVTGALGHIGSRFVRSLTPDVFSEVVLVDTGALCSEIYTPELFTKVRRPIWPLDPI